MTDILYEGKFLNMVSNDGWEYVTRKDCDVAVVMAILTHTQLIVVNEYRKPLDKRVIGLPAGISEPSEDIFGTARRELIEETGYEAGCIRMIAKNLPSSPGLTDETFNMLKATELMSVGDGGGDETEDIKVEILDLSKARETIDAWLRDGCLIDPKLYAALWFCNAPRV